MCARCDAEAADYAAKAQAAYAANGYKRLIDAIRHEDELTAQVAGLIFDLPGMASDQELTTAARAVIDAVRAFDEQTALMRDAADDHQAQNNEGRF